MPTRVCPDCGGLGRQFSERTACPGCKGEGHIVVASKGDDAPLTPIQQDDAMRLSEEIRTTPFWPRNTAAERNFP